MQVLAKVRPMSPRFGVRRGSRRGMGCATCKGQRGLGIDVTCPTGVVSVGLWQYLTQDQSTTCAPFTPQAAAAGTAQALASAGYTPDQIAAALAQVPAAPGSAPSIDWITLALLAAAGLGLVYIAGGH